MLLYVLLLFYSLFQRRRRKWEYKFWLSLLIIGTGIVLTSLVTTFLSRHTSFIYTPSRTFYVLPFIFILVGFLLESLQNKRIVLLFAGSIAMVSVAGIYNYSANRSFLMPVYAVPWESIVEKTVNSDVVIPDEAICFRYYADRHEQFGPRIISPVSLSSLKSLMLDSDGSGTASLSVSLVLTERESTTSEVPDSVTAFLNREFNLISDTVFVEYDDSYKWLKSKLLKRSPGEGKVHLYTYER